MWLKFCKVFLKKKTKQNGDSVHNAFASLAYLKKKKKVKFLPSIAFSAGGFIYAEDRLLPELVIYPDFDP